MRKIIYFLVLNFISCEHNSSPERQVRMFFFDFFSRENTERQVVFFLCAFPWQTCLRLCSPLFLRCLGMISLRRAHCFKKKIFFKKQVVFLLPSFLFPFLFLRCSGLRALGLAHCVKKKKKSKNRSKEIDIAPEIGCGRISSTQPPEKADWDVTGKI